MLSSRGPVLPGEGSACAGSVSEALVASILGAVLGNWTFRGTMEQKGFPPLDAPAQRASYRISCLLYSSLNLNWFDLILTRTKIKYDYDLVMINRNIVNLYLFIFQIKYFKP